jgi:hypothetical protein
MRRLEYEAIALGDALATAAGKAVLDLQGSDRFVEVDAPEPWWGGPGGKDPAASGCAQ